MDNLKNIVNKELIRKSPYINGEWVNIDGEYQVYNPANDQLLVNMQKCSEKEANDAINAAYEAFPKFSALTPKERAKLLYNWKKEILSNIDDLAVILSSEQGKPIAEAKGEILYGVNYIDWYAEEAKRIYGDVISSNNKDKKIIVIKQPVGVVACITPWNFPSAMLARKLAPAFAAGCTVICKPANETPLSAYALAYLAEKAGFPKGVFNIISGDTKKIGATITASKKVRKITFTGSTNVGKLLYSQSAANLKKLSMELGGNAPYIIFADADLELAVNHAVICKYRNSGQTCVCANRIYVHKDIFKKFTQKLKDSLISLKIGSFDQEGVNFGPLIHRQAKDKILKLVEDAVKNGAEEITKSDNGHGNFLPPKILVNVKKDDPICSEEIFGPVAVLYEFSSDEEVMHMANDTNYGLASYIFTNDYRRMIKLSEGLEYGMVSINDGILSNEAAPFGGIKESGFGREGSKYGIDDYLNIKYISIGGL